MQYDHLTRQNANADAIAQSYEASVEMLKSIEAAIVADIQQHQRVAIVLDEHLADIRAKINADADFALRSRRRAGTMALAPQNRGKSAAELETDRQEAAIQQELEAAEAAEAARRAAETETSAAAEQPEPGMPQGAPFPAPNGGPIEDIPPFLRRQRPQTAA